MKVTFTGESANKLFDALIKSNIFERTNIKYNNETIENNDVECWKNDGCYAESSYSSELVIYDKDDKLVATLYFSNKAEIVYDVEKREVLIEYTEKHSNIFSL